MRQHERLKFPQIHQQVYTNRNDVNYFSSKPYAKQDYAARIPTYAQADNRAAYYKRSDLDPRTWTDGEKRSDKSKTVFDLDWPKVVSRSPLRPSPLISRSPGCRTPYLVGSTLLLGGCNS